MYVSGYVTKEKKPKRQDKGFRTYAVGRPTTGGPTRETGGRTRARLLGRGWTVTDSSCSEK